MNQKLANEAKAATGAHYEARERKAGRFDTFQKYGVFKIKPGRGRNQMVQGFGRNKEAAESHADSLNAQAATTAGMGGSW